MKRTAMFLAALYAAMVFTGSLLAQDPARTTIRLTYEMPVEAMQRSLADRPDIDLEQLLAESIRNVQKRVPDGAVVARGDATKFTVDVKNTTRAEIEEVRRRIETTGRLEMRMVADDDYAPVRLQLPEARKRLQQWLDGGGRDQLMADPSSIDGFHAGAKDGAVARGHLRWFVHRVKPSQEVAGRWSWRLQDIPTLAAVVVSAHTDEDWNGGTIPQHIQARPAPERHLIELVAVNMHETFFANRHLDPTGTKVHNDAAGNAGVIYRIRPIYLQDYADWTEQHVGKFCAILWENEVLTTPVFRSRIVASGIISGVAAADAPAMAHALRAPLVAKPELVEIKTR